MDDNSFSDGVAGPGCAPSVGPASALAAAGPVVRPSRNRFKQWVKRGMARVLPRRLFVDSGPADDRGVYLTFDDGPSPELTPRLLDLLRDHGAVATFFVLGMRAERNPDLIRRMVDEGHCVGHHTYSHCDLRRASTSEFLADLSRTRAILAPLVGRPSNLFRPPHGRLSLPDLLRLWRAGQTVVLWNDEPERSAQAESEAATEAWDDYPLNGGEIVLLHDDHPFAHRALPRIIESALRRGLEFRTIDLLIRS